MTPEGEALILRALFDAMGNRLSRQDSASGTTNSLYNAANMLLSTAGTGASTYSNDADGNTLSGGGRTNAWDSQNRLVSRTGRSRVVGNRRAALG